MKKQTKISIMLALATAVILFVTLPNMAKLSAYFIDSSSAENFFVWGFNEIEIEEYFPVAEGRTSQTLTKEVSVTNTGSVDCYVRIFADFESSYMKEYCFINWNDADFTYNDDGYWYYNYILGPDEQTPYLMTEISIADRIPDGYTDFDIIVYAESVQATGFDTAEDAWAFFNK